MEFHSDYDKGIESALASALSDAVPTLHFLENGPLGLRDHLLFACSCNPPTLSHRAMLEVAKKNSSACITVVISCSHPAKSLSELSLLHSMKMAVRAFDGIASSFAFVSGESGRYIELVSAINRGRLRRQGFSLLLGMDNAEKLLELHTSSEIDQIASTITKVIVNLREGIDEGAPELSVLRRRFERVEVIFPEGLEPSSTFVRALCSLRAPDALRECVPEGVYRYIHDQQLYRTPMSDELLKYVIASHHRLVNDLQLRGVVVPTTE